MKYNYTPANKQELKDLISRLIKERGNKANLNDINTILISDMSSLFSSFYKFNGDISRRRLI
jgi:hypothetical protein